jgi:galactose mutarotase-like enzyme
MYSLKNNLLHINIKHKGAELSNIISVENNIEFMWQANPNIWGSHAPNLFPIIGSMKDDSYIYNSTIYNVSKHGFARHNEDFTIKHQTDTSITFSLVSNKELYNIYPFNFEFIITYTLSNNQLQINHTIKNLDKKPLYFSVGGHPAFNCPLSDDENYTDYYLEFDKKENSTSYILNTSNGLITNKTKPVFTNGNQIQLHDKLFNEDALIFKDLKSRKVSLKSLTKGNILTVDFEGFPYLGIWAKPNAPYVCIEPWLGIADSETTNQKIEDKEGIIKLDAGLDYNASYSIEIDKTHLV